MVLAAATGAVMHVLPSDGSKQLHPTGMQITYDESQYRRLTPINVSYPPLPSMAEQEMLEQHLHMLETELQVLEELQQAPVYASVSRPPATRAVQLAEPAPSEESTEDTRSMLPTVVEVPEQDYETLEGVCEVKGNITSSGQFYYPVGCIAASRVVIDETKGERYFCSTEEAIAAGFTLAESCQ